MLNLLLLTLSLIFLLGTNELAAQEHPIVDLALGNVYVYECDRRQKQADWEHLKIDGVIRYWTQILRIDSVIEINGQQVFRVTSRDHEGNQFSDRWWAATPTSFYELSDRCSEGQVRMLYHVPELKSNTFADWCFPPIHEDYHDGGYPLSTRVNYNSMACFRGDCPTQEWRYMAYFPCYGACNDFEYKSTAGLGLIGFEELEWTVPGLDVHQWRLRGAFINGQLFGDTSDVVTSVFANQTKPTSTALKLAPNPADTHFSIDFELKTEARVQVKLIDPRGLTVKRIAPREFSAGLHTVAVATDDLEVGIYILKVRIGNNFKSKMLSILR